MNIYSSYPRYPSSSWKGGGILHASGTYHSTSTDDYQRSIAHLVVKDNTSTSRINRIELSCNLSPLSKNPIHNVQSTHAKINKASNIAFYRNYMRRGLPCSKEKVSWFLDKEWIYYEFWKFKLSLTIFRIGNRNWKFNPVHQAETSLAAQLAVARWPATSLAENGMVKLSQ
jgi:hypothetical protein